MVQEKKRTSDFRYATGTSRVPWTAVGESVREDEIMAMVEFLVRPRAGKTTEHKARMQRLRNELTSLGEVSQPAGKLTLGGKVEELENRVVKMLGVKHAVFLNNATAGFEIAYKFAGLQPGDEVIAPAITFIATIAYPLSIGAKVVLADVDPRTMNMAPEDVKRKITKRTKVIIPVHIGGYPADMAPIMALAKKHNITVIEDAAHSFGATYKGKMTGGIGHFGAFSFHEVKNITSLGEGGILVSNSSEYGPELRRARFLGLDLSRQIENWLYDVPALKGKAGYFATGNYSVTELQAVCLLSQLKRLKSIIAKRRKAAQYLNRRFKNVAGLVPPPMDDDGVKSTHHLYLLQVDPKKAGADVQTFKKKLQARGLTQIPHFAPLYKFSVMRQLGYDTEKIQESCCVAEEAFRHRFTHLPLYELNEDQLTYMADAVIDAVTEMKREAGLANQ